MEDMPTLYTERLILRPLQLADAETVQREFAHWDVVRYLNAAVPWPYPEDGALAYLRDIALPAVAAGKEWHWTLRLKSAPDQPDGSGGQPPRLLAGAGVARSGFDDGSLRGGDRLLVQRSATPANARAESRAEHRLAQALGTRGDALDPDR